MPFKASHKRFYSPPADGVYYFNAITIAQLSLRVCAFRYDFLVDFDCHAALRIAVFNEQVGHADRFGHFLLYAIQENSEHVASVVLHSI